MISDCTDNGYAIDAWLAAGPRAPSLPPVDHLASPQGRVQVEKALASKVIDLIAGHGAATKDALRCGFTCREIHECLPGALRRLPSHIRELALAA